MVILEYARLYKGLADIFVVVKSLRTPNRSKQRKRWSFNAQKLSSKDTRAYDYGTCCSILTWSIITTGTQVLKILKN